MSKLAKGFMLFMAVCLISMCFASIFSLYPEYTYNNPVSKFILNPFILFAEFLVILWLYLNPALLSKGTKEYIQAYRSGTRYKALNYISMLFMLIGIIHVIIFQP